MPNGKSAAMSQVDIVAVLEAAGIGVAHDEWGESVKAVVVLKPGASASGAEIIDTVPEGT